MIKITPIINSLYIHIPFCNSICFYCDFPKLLKIDAFINKYIDALLFELDSYKINHKFKTIYIGGGTPTSIDLTKLLNALDKYIDSDTEFTIEGNVLDFNDELLTSYKAHHVNRISLGVEAMNDDILKILGRKHTSKDVINKINLIKQYVPNINIDLIYGLKELDNNLLIQELKEYIKLDVNHISTYSLEIHEGTKFYNDKRKELDPSIIREQFDIIYDYLSKNSFKRYEISNFAKANYESKHNITYWKDDRYIGLGLGAAGYIANYRYKNTNNIKEYIAHKFIKEKEIISLEDDKKYYLMTNLRLTEGINLLDYQKRFDEDLYLNKKCIIDNLISRKLLKKEYTNLITTYEGSMLLDIILKELF